MDGRSGDDDAGGAPVVPDGDVGAVGLEGVVCATEHDTDLRWCFSGLRI